MYARSLIILILATFTVACTQIPVTNNWEKIDDFQTNLKSWYQVDTQNQTKPHIANPQVTVIETESIENNYLLKKPAADGIIGNRKALSYKKLPTPVQLGETYTFYVRINVESFPNNHAFGLSNLQPHEINKHGYDAFEPTLRVTDKAESNGFKNDGALMVKTNEGYANIRNYNSAQSAKPLQPDTWYEIWYVVNNAPIKQGGQKYDVYVKGGEFNQQTLVYKDASFRMKREQPLIYFLANCNTGPHKRPYGNGGLRYDDLYMIEGFALSRPF
ncbi:hypothetical protein J8L70_04455 [Pseudoalteromonas sp. MMG010]|uniref:hypothetical protein n=1 Tax=Pseudoalteromonas sp. MMG010 TaxID=2822685 RepID=UPI001B3A6FB0|nr:hypothetical protein [Pseudoalteromonas sp. MMG010]MBQ4832486.1 hypothetical protein [Pseudoalteromonas sp. MMG010]